jgi:predicted MFS family arabinose efflux permease
MTSESNNAPRLRYQLIAATFARMVVNTAHRMFYPFLPALSRGLGVPPETLRFILSVRGAFGMSAPLFGPIGDRFGRRNAMLIGLAVFCAALTLVAIFPNLWTLFVAILLIIACKFIFDPALQAYLSERTPYSQRGLVIGLAELGWSGAFLLGVPLVGFLIERGGWRAAFLPLTVLALMGGMWIAFAIPADAPPTHHAKANGLSQSLAVLRNPIVLAALTVSLLISAANESLNVVYGDWLEQSFALSVAQLGLTTMVVGISELIGEGGVAVLSDRLGKRQTLALGLAISAASYFVLPFVSGKLEWAMAGVFAVYLAFEFAIVASLPLISELLPESRNAVMSTTIAFHAAGRMIGALVGGFLFRYGFVWNGVAAGLMTLVGIPLILWVVRERR